MKAEMNDWSKIDADMRPPYNVEINSTHVNITSGDHLIATMQIERRFAMPVAFQIALACNRSLK